MESKFFNMMTNSLNNASGVKLILTIDDYGDLDIHGIASDESFAFGMWLDSFDEFMGQLVLLVQEGGNYKYVMTGTYEDCLS